MFRKQVVDTNPFDTIYADIGKPNTSDAEKYPTHLTHGSTSFMNWESKGRFTNIVSYHDANFPDYNANLIGSHVLLEGPAQHNAGHCERFLQVLANDKVQITDVIAAGDPFDGREEGKRGYWHYFSHDNDVVDAKISDALRSRYEVSSVKTGKTEGISSYQVSIQYDGLTKQIKVHHIENFGDFTTMVFTIAELRRLLAIYQESKNLAIHCSAGMGRTGVLELAFCLFAESTRFYPNGVPDFKEIQAKLEELRVLRPALVQGHAQYRMAVIVGMQLELVNHNELTNDKDVRDIESVVDLAARQAIRARYYLAPESSDEEANEASEHSQLSGDESNRVSETESPQQSFKRRYP